MAVLVEGISVVVRVASIKAKFRGDMEGFMDNVPNATFCADSDLVRVGFMTPDDVGFYIESLEERGLVFMEEGEAVDIVVVDQREGPTTPCDWVELVKVHLGSLGENTISACQLKDSNLDEVCMPEGWTYEESLSCAHGFVPLGKEDKSLTFLRHEDGKDVYLNRLTGKEMFVGRTGKV
jgi:hypothetical protein